MRRESKSRSPRWLAKVPIVYMAYLLALGPFWGIEGRLQLLPDSALELIFVPAKPLIHLPVAGRLLEVYLDTWWIDPKAPETTR